MSQFTAIKALSVDPYLTICMLISLYVQHGDLRVLLCADWANVRRIQGQIYQVKVNEPLLEQPGLWGAVVCPLKKYVIRKTRYNYTTGTASITVISSRDKAHHIVGLRNIVMSQAIEIYVLHKRLSNLYTHVRTELKGQETSKNQLKTKQLGSWNIYTVLVPILDKNAG